ncbi:MAG: sulfatase family protein [Promethearchaeota archaeon]
MAVKPNILIIHADQHRFDCLGCMGNNDIRTPNIDALARDGVVFKNCFSTFPVCTPSRYSFITGLYAHQHLGWSNKSTLPRGIATFPRILKHNGYETACVGKMHYTPTYADVGFETMVLAEQDGPGRYDDDYHRYLRDKGLVDGVDLRDQVIEYRRSAGKDYFENYGIEPSNLLEEDYSTTWIGDRAVEVLGGWVPEKPALLMVGFIKPHHPHDAPHPWCEMYDDPEKITMLPGWTDECLSRDMAFNRGYFDYTNLTGSAMKKVMAQYYSSISQIDNQVGRFVEILKEKGLYENTLVVFTSDHGDYLGFHHLILKSNYMYDPVIKVPLVVKYPRSFESGRESTGLVSVIDLTATILDQSGCPIPQHLWDSVMPLDVDEGREFVYAEDNHGNYMVRSRSRKLLLCKSKKSQFFDLELDPLELHNVIDDPVYKADVEALKWQLSRWALFESRSTLHLDEFGPTNSSKNAMRIDDGHRLEIKEYFRNKMKNFLGEKYPEE